MRTYEVVIFYFAKVLSLMLLLTEEILQPWVLSDFAVFGGACLSSKLINVWPYCLYRSDEVEAGFVRTSVEERSACST